MAFVDGLAKLIGIDNNQVFFLICQIFAIFCGCILRVYIPPGSSRSKQRHLFEFIIGVLVLYMGYGPYIIHLVIQAIPAYLMLVFLPLSFAQYGILIFSMAYLSAIHIYQLYTGNHSSVDISAPLMVQTQKLSSLAFNINDGVRIAAGIPVIRECHKLNAIARRPRLLQLGGYLFCFHNCMIGPSMFFADYLRFIEGREADRILDTDLQWRFNQKKDEIRVARAELLKQLKLLLLHTLLIVWAFSNFKPDRLLDDDFARKTFWQKYIYVTIACFAFRQRFYFAWTISCVANLCAGFGFSGFDDHGKPEYRFAANIHFLPIELGTSTKTILDAWNTATTRWLRECVYDRVPKRYAVWAVFVASAIWHGFHPGFYLAFVSAALITVCGR
ncbi:Membrane-bound O-acyltransferase domain-containing protein 2 [Fasciola gigantica]|uniref:Membrane-bound O-acyltransferase domain-containing protein 2 n=1 Tax=Fasciola gigantica TaxID=46835 RepID=A0A504Y7J5_FASGI|nr:Membrane-bound O-acyltransferase domain-containing protein 2 [Fasciola gigantica]